MSTYCMNFRQTHTSNVSKPIIEISKWIIQLWILSPSSWTNSPVFLPEMGRPSGGACVSPGNHITFLGQGPLALSPRKEFSSLKNHKGWASTQLDSENDSHWHMHRQLGDDFFLNDECEIVPLFLCIFWEGAKLMTGITKREVFVYHLQVSISDNQELAKDTCPKN